MSSRGQSLSMFVVQRTFSRVRRGYDPAEVDRHLELVNSWFTGTQVGQALSHERAELQQRERSLGEREAELARALEGARLEADGLVEGARRRAPADARAGERALAAAREEAAAIRATAEREREELLDVPRFAWPSCRWMMFSGTPSRASSSGCAWRSWWGAKRRRTPARRASRRNSLRTAAPDHGRPRVGPSMMQNSDPTGSATRAFRQGRSCSPPPLVHPDLCRRPPLPWRTRIDPRRWVEVVLGERERRLDAQAGAPQDDHHCSHAQAVTVIGRGAHDRHDLLHRGPIRWVAHTVVARRATGVVPRHRRRPAAPTAASSPDGTVMKSSSDRTADTPLRYTRTEPNYRSRCCPRPASRRHGVQPRR
jgi:DivIVA domain-containing protein